MSELCRFHGAVIQMFPRDHDPPHIHVRHGGRRARIAINDVEVVSGALPPNIERLVLEWTRVRQAELRQAWRSIRSNETPGKIAPLD